MNYFILKKEIKIKKVNNLNAQKNSEIDSEFASNGPFKLPAWGSTEDKNLIGFLIKIYMELDKERPYHVNYDLKYIPVRYGSINNIFNSAEENIVADSEIMNDTDPAVFRLTNFQKIDYSTRVPVPKSIHAIDTGFEFQPSAKIRGWDISDTFPIRKFDFAFLGKNTYRYLLHDIYEQGSGVLTISGARITIGRTVNNVNTPITSGDGYFSLKFETSCPSKNYLDAQPRIVGNLEKLALIPNIAISPPCPPLWHPDYFPENVDPMEFSTWFCAFKAKAMQEMDPENNQTENPEE